VIHGVYRITEVITVFVLDKILQESRIVEDNLLEMLTQESELSSAGFLFETVIAYLLKLVLQDPVKCLGLMQLQETSIFRPRDMRTRRRDAGQQTASGDTTRAADLLQTLRPVRFGTGFVRFVNCKILGYSVQQARQVFF
jgi:hypothetical protein